MHSTRIQNLATKFSRMSDDELVRDEEFVALTREDVRALEAEYGRRAEKYEAKAAGYRRHAATRPREGE